MVVFLVDAGTLVSIGPLGRIGTRIPKVNFPKQVVESTDT